MDVSVAFLRKLKVELPYYDMILLPDMHPKELNHYIKDVFAVYITCSTIHNSQDMESTKVTTDRRTDKENVTYMQWTVYYSAVK
jgi:hypothetical protein